MPDHERPPAKPTAGRATDARPARPALAEAQMRRWADLVAAGAAEAPTDLLPAQLEELVARVRLLRRARLIAYLARQVALDLRRHDPPPDGPAPGSIPSPPN